MASDADYELAKIRFKRLYQKAKDLKIRDDDLKKFSFVKRYKEEKLNIVSLAVKWLFIVLVVCTLVLAGVFVAVKTDVLAAKTLAEWSTIFTGIDLKTDACVYPFSESLLDVFRPPVDCSFCRGITKFDRVSQLSQQDFVEKYAYSGRPVIITDATKNWTATEKFSFEFIKSVYRKDSPVLSGDSKECQFFPYQTKFATLSDVFKMPAKMKNMEGKPWYIGWSNCDPKAANVLRKHYTRPYFLSPEMESSRTDWLFMGTPGYGAHMHIDAVQQSSWQAQIQGNKTWMLEPPPECYYECVGFQDTVKAGEIVVLDTNKWFHGTNVVGDKLSIVIGSEYD
ncbi:uncharacterized protein LOC130613150 [Hydractinia symbiolongicarpus]|uniref:uncharacterized protein LOC130613150 n=1 Tax=Hydractinia symbiolongicarpus TaxID=13093 RepID=UPI00254C50B7|nr:uncharacterized protein LOC130613150 [Hydractinia symbiolongicarpus]